MDIYNDEKPVFVFALDKEDYNNDIFNKKKAPEFYQLLEKSPPDNDQFGLGRLKSKITEFKVENRTNHIKEKEFDIFKGIGQENKDDFRLMLQSEYYQDYQQAKHKKKLEIEKQKGIFPIDEFGRTIVPNYVFRAMANLFVKIWISTGG